MIRIFDWTLAVTVLAFLAAVVMLSAIDASGWQ